MACPPFLMTLINGCHERTLMREMLKERRRHTVERRILSDRFYSWRYSTVPSLYITNSPLSNS